MHEYNVGQYDPNLGAAFINTGGQAFLPGAFLTPFGANTAGAGLLSPLAVGAPFAALPAAGAAGLLAAGGFQGAAASSALNLAGPQKRPDDKYGWAVQGGLKFNLPFIAAGDLLYLQAAYAKGPLSYSGKPLLRGPAAIHGLGLRRAPAAAAGSTRTRPAPPSSSGVTNSPDGCFSASSAFLACATGDAVRRARVVDLLLHQRCEHPAGADRVAGHAGIGGLERSDLG